jgi:hypothetical protein
MRIVVGTVMSSADRRYPPHNQRWGSLQNIDEFIRLRVTMASDVLDAANGDDAITRVNVLRTNFLFDDQYIAVLSDM